MIETSNHTLEFALSKRHLPPVREEKPENGGGRGMFKSVSRLVQRGDKKNLEPVIELALEIAREGREGRRIGTLFTFGDADAVLKRSRPLILDPLAGHTEEERQIRDVNLRGTIKELAQLDGAFVVSDHGIVVSACRYLDAMASDVALPYGMASRHLAGASISQVTDAVAIVVSESSMVRVFDDGKLVAEIIPELWLMDHYNVQLSRPYDEERLGDLAVLTAKARPLITDRHFAYRLLSVKKVLSRLLRLIRQLDYFLYEQVQALKASPLLTFDSRKNRGGVAVKKGKVIKLH